MLSPSPEPAWTSNFTFLKILDHGSSHPTKPLSALAGTPTGRDDAAYSLVVIALGLSGHLS